MPNFSARPPVTELYDPRNVVGFVLANQNYRCIKGTFKEEIVEIPSPYETGRPEVKQMFECNLVIDNDDEFSGRVIRFLGSSSSIVAVMVDDL